VTLALIFAAAHSFQVVSGIQVAPPWVGFRERERERERERDKEREKEREKERQKERERERESFIRNHQ
jgi:hypothetical protein